MAVVPLLFSCQIVELCVGPVLASAVAPPHPTAIHSVIMGAALAAVALYAAGDGAGGFGLVKPLVASSCELTWRAAWKFVQCR